jgi:DNA-binding MarR family transcriptional regulator
MELQDATTGVLSVEDYRFGESVGYLIKRVRAAMSNAVDRELVQFDISHEQLTILMLIQKKGGATAAELSREISCDTSSMTRMIDRLEAKGMVIRSRSEDDRRVIWIAITESGLALANRLPELLVRITNRTLAGFTRDEVDVLKSLLRRMVENSCEPISHGRNPASMLDATQSK